MLDEERAAEVVEKVLATASADHVDVSLNGSSTANLRFARNTVSTSGTQTDASVSVTTTFGTRSGSSTVNQLSDESLEVCVRRAEELAKLSPEDPEFMPPLPQQEIAAIDAGVDPSPPEVMAEGARVCIAEAERAGLVAAGFAKSSSDVECMANSAGFFGFHRSGAATFSMTARTEAGDGSGWSSRVGEVMSDIDFRSAASQAVEKARRSVKPKPLEPASYVTILEPACVADLVARLMWNLDARETDEGRSWLSKPGGGNQIGDELFPKWIQVRSDPGDPACLQRPWAYSGLPQVPRVWIADGKVQTVRRDRFWAKNTETEPVPFAPNTLMSGSDKSVEDLVRETERGVLITSLWYIRSVDPQTLLCTGLTRDGIFWIEDGEIAHPVTNFRWNDSPVRVLKNALEASRPVRVSPRGWGSTNVVVPALKVSGFELSSVSDAI